METRPFTPYIATLCHMPQKVVATNSSCQFQAGSRGSWNVINVQNITEIASFMCVYIYVYIYNK